LDGLEVTIVGAVSGVLQDPKALHLSSEAIGAIASCYVAGAVIGALGFGWLTDRLGRRKMFYWTLAIYLLGVLLSALSWNAASLGAFRFITGLGIGGEYAAINSAIDELVPARLRGRIDLIVNGSYWIGAALGAAATIVLLDPKLLPVGLGILLLRRFVPESPRWLVTHGFDREAEAVVGDIEHRVEEDTGAHLDEPEKSLRLNARRSFGLGLIARTMVEKYRGRSALALVLMIAQAFLYNAVFFTYGLILVRFYGVDAARTGLYLLPLAAGNFLGPLLLGHFFDTIGRRRMIAATFGIAALLLLATALLFALGMLSGLGQTVAWTVIFFFASAASGSAYLTASEIFPLETRALAIAVFYAAGTAIGGILAPALFGLLIASNSRWALFAGYALASVLMIGASVMELLYGIDAEGKSLEAISDPLSAG